MSDVNEKYKNAYKIVMSELGLSPFQKIKDAFALMGLIPLLVVFYVIIGKNFFHMLLLGNNAVMLVMAIFISFMGLLYAYSLIKKLVDKLMKYAAERKHADDEKTEIMLAVSHDLRTPLTTMKLGLQNLADGIGGTLNDSGVEMVKDCLTAANKLKGLIEDILDFPKTGLVRLNIKRELVDLGCVLKNEVQSAVHLAKKNRLDLKYSPVSARADVWCDQKKMSRAVMNLISNAVKYTPEGGSIDVILSPSESTVQFSVINTGPGIRPDEIDRIFKKYERLDKHSHIDGKGLGLSIVKDIIDLHNGHISVHSEPNKITEFRVILPKDLRTRIGISTAKTSIEL
ncbi:MAG: HAMP domain-containing sensor histidine kinase [Candidatus Omnitrophica bacterium]|nr:HAMP domain-containing sensor histidine kinase [Candidatus Omnitrophota bacterium]